MNARASADYSPVNGLLWKVLAFDKSPIVLSSLPHQPRTQHTLEYKIALKVPMASSDTEHIFGGGLGNLGAKIGRAHKHLKEFDSLVVDYCRPDAYTIAEHDDLVNKCHILHVEFKVIPGDIHLSLADAIYCLRSGLDQLAWQLALLGNPTPSRDVMFPIHSDQSIKAEERFRKLVWDMPCEAVAIIKDLQPYNRGAAYRDDPLWQLNELSNIDKHRLPTGRATDANFNVEPSGGTRHDLDYGIEISWPLPLEDAVVFKPSRPTLVFGDPLDSSRSVPLELTREDIAKIYNFVRNDVAPRFARFFPVPP
jgi:hypothetical protein